MDRFFFVWFGFKGRIGRRTWLLFAVILSILGYLAELLIRRAFHIPDQQSTGEDPFISAYLGGETAILTELIFLWPSLAIDIKRWHDLGRSGWMTLIFYLPALALFVLEVLGAGGTVSHPEPRAAALLYAFGLVVLAYFIIMTARKGMAGSNRFGPPPA